MNLSGWSKSMAAGKRSPRRRRLISISRLARQVEQLERGRLVATIKLRHYRIVCQGYPSLAAKPPGCYIAALNPASFPPPRAGRRTDGGLPQGRRTRAVKNRNQPKTRRHSHRAIRRTNGI